MSKSIRSYPKSEQAAVARRRVAGKTGGLGYHSAVAWQKRAGQVVMGVVIVENEEDYVGPTAEDLE